MNYIAHYGFSNDLVYLEICDRIEYPMTLSYKMERLLAICKHQREVHITRLRSKGDPRCSSERPDDDYLMIFDDDDTKTIYNTWRADVRTYMSLETLATRETVSGQEAQLLEKKSHATYMSQLTGSKWLLRQFLRLPLAYGPSQTPTSSVAQPAWHQLLSCFEEHKNSPEYHKAVKDHPVVLSYRLSWARHNHAKGKNISFKIRAGNVEFDTLSQNDQSLVSDYECGRSASLNALMKEKQESVAGYFNS